MAKTQDKRDAKRRMIFDAAIKLMQERSYDDVTIKDICEEAGIYNGMFFYYFKTKDELLDLYLTDVYDDYLAEHGPLNDSSGDFIKQIVDLYHCYIEYCEQAGINFIRSYYSTSNKALDSHAFSGNNTMNTTMMRDLGYLMEAQRKGHIRSSSSPVDITIDCCTMVKGIIFEWCVSEGALDPIASADRILGGYLKAQATEEYFKAFGD